MPARQVGPARRDGENTGGSNGRCVDRRGLELARRLGCRDSYLGADADPVTLAILRWGIGFLLVLPATLLAHAKWPPLSDWPGVAALGLAFFGLFFIPLPWPWAVGH